jgi:hypothetical protein
MGRLPNFLYIGPDKAGSSWLYEALNLHPDIFLSPAKDLYFFDRFYDRGLSWYAEQFRGAQSSHRVVGEVCPDYLAAREAPERIAKDLPDVKLMVTLREPMSRALSSYLYMRKHGEGPATFGEALVSFTDLIEHGRYASQLQHYLRFVDRSQLHIALFDDLEADPQRFVDEVVSWLGLTPRPLDPEVLEPRLPASEARFTPVAWAARRAAEVVRRLNGAQAVGLIKRSSLVQRALYRQLVTKPQLADEDVNVLRDHLTGEMVALERDFGIPVRRLWGW